MYKTNEPEKEEHENSKSVSNSETEMTGSIENSQNVNQDIEVDGGKFRFDVKYVDDLSLHDMSANSKYHNPPSAN